MIELILNFLKQIERNELLASIQEKSGYQNQNTLPPQLHPLLNVEDGEF